MVVGTNSIIDISSFQGNPDFKRVKAAGIIGVIHKATEGLGFHDSAYAANKKAAKAEGLLWGAYHFGTGSDPEKQAEEFLNVAAVGKDELIVLDFETNKPPGTQITVPAAKLFVNRVLALTGRRPGIYSGNTIKEALGNTADPELGKCFLWVAQFDTSPNAPQIHKTWSRFTLWQFTDGKNGPLPHTVDGIKGPCDRDTFNGDEATLKAFWTNGGALPTASPSTPTV
jgi:lysozyme